MTIGVVNDSVPITMGGSADLTHSNLTLSKGIASLTPDDFSGRYVRYGIREFGMAAAMNGIALHGGFIPFGGTFMVFSDYARGAMRLSALMGIRVIYVFTHDSIGVGEDGPTHQPVEHLADAARDAEPAVFRPADAVETAECWELALNQTHTPSALALSRQNLPALRNRVTSIGVRSALMYSPRMTGERDVTLLATGSEVSLAVDAAKALREKGKRVAVVSMPCWELFEAQDEAYRVSVLGSAPRIAVEAAERFGWDRWIGEKRRLHRHARLRRQRPRAGALYKHCGITVEAVVAAAGARPEGVQAAQKRIVA